MARVAQDVYRLHVTTNGTFDVADESCYVAGIIISTSTLGSAWSVKLQDKAAVPMAILSSTVLTSSLPIPWIIDFTTIRPNAVGGVNLITSGTTPGIIDVWLMCTIVQSSY